MELDTSHILKMYVYIMTEHIMVISGGCQQNPLI